MQPRIMFIDCKANGLQGSARIGRVEYSNSGRTVYYRGRELMRVKGGYKYNYVDVENQDHYWISGCKRRGGDTLYGGVIPIDDDVREEYWTLIRNKPECVHQTSVRCPGKYNK